MNYQTKRYQTDPKFREYVLTKNKESQRRRPVAYLLSRAKRRGTEECTITVDDIVMPTCCPCCGVLLKFGKPRRNVPTLDRIDNTCGYILGNVIVVCYRCNRAKGDLTIAELVQLANFYSNLTSSNVARGDNSHVRRSEENGN